MVSFVGDGKGKSFLGKHERQKEGRDPVISEHVVTCCIVQWEGVQKLSRGIRS